MLTVFKNDKFGEIANLARSNEWLAKNSNEMAKNGLLVIRHFYKDSKWQIWKRIQERFKQN